MINIQRNSPSDTAYFFVTNFDQSEVAVGLTNVLNTYIQNGAKAVPIAMPMMRSMKTPLMQRKCCLKYLHQFM